jgi:hypothetical protein
MAMMFHGVPTFAEVVTFWGSGFSAAIFKAESGSPKKSTAF